MPTIVLPRRRCDNCGAFYRPKQRLKKNDRHGFCKPACKKEFHKHGGSFGKLKPVIEKAVKERIKALSPADANRMEAIERRLQTLEEFCGRLIDVIARSTNITASIIEEREAK